MAFTAQVLKVMIASPSDVASERLKAQQAIHSWNALHAEDRGQVLLPVAWETHAAPAIGERAQAIINRQLLEGADVLVAIFWTRLGTPTGEAPSGTVEEIHRHLAAGKPVMIYFSAAPVAPESVDPSQYGELKTFRDWAKANGLIEIYESLGEFNDKFTRQLTKTIMDRFPRQLGAASSAATSTRDGTADVLDARRRSDEENLMANVSSDAKELLRLAATDNNGTVFVTETFGGVSVETAGQNMITEPKNPRQEAKWRRAVGELESGGFLERRDLRGEVLALTDLGYRAADVLGH